MSTVATTRNYTIDAGRLIASLFVLALHVDLGIQDGTTIALIKLGCRWAVPFFFLVSGYFYQIRFAKDPAAAFKKNTLRLLKIYLITCVVYLPLAYKETGVFFKPAYLYNGTYGPLWFLPSMILGFVVLYLLHLLRLSQKAMLAVSLLFMAFVLLKDSYANLIPGFSALPNHHKRIFISIPFLFFGMCIQQQKSWFLQHINWLGGAALIVAGYFLQVAEAYMLQSLKQYPLWGHQFLIGTGLIAFGVFAVVLTVHSGASKLSRWGELYSLMIYLYHPLIIACLISLQSSAGFTTSWPLVMVCVVFGVTLLVVNFVYQYLPGVFGFLSGSFTIPFEKQPWIRSWKA
ncbi:acyltransferase [Spirosoma sp. KNUC1025]|uniref:acyltransferase n=1 Tax=Spirosoma sp. KNUC1025 TaxID=2894082 RepID=UPI003863BD03|nr:acyltransferase [Spirosoma sp. KNUC1025]